MSTSNHPGRPLLAILLGACLLLPTAALAANHEEEGDMSTQDAMGQESTTGEATGEATDAKHKDKDKKYQDKDGKAHDDMSADEKMMEDQEKMMEGGGETMQEDDSM